MALSIVAIGLVGMGNGFQGHDMALFRIVVWHNNSMSACCHTGPELKNVCLNPHEIAGCRVYSNQIVFVQLATRPLRLVAPCSSL